MPRLDVVAAPATSPHVLERARAFAARVNAAARVAVRAVIVRVDVLPSCSRRGA